MANPNPGDEQVASIRSRLNKNRVKLWLPPYTLDDGSKGTYPDDFVQGFCKDLNMDSNLVVSILEQLRKHSLAKLSARQKMQEKGVAMLTVKIAGTFKMEKMEHSIEIGLQALGSELKEKVSASCGIPVERLKLIGCGRVIDSDKPLIEQHIRPEAHVMAMILSESEAAAKAQDEEQSKLKQARQDAELISTQSAGIERDDFYVEIADQSGNPLNLPRAERKALALAMTLHERAKAAMRRKEYAYALLLLLEADEEFSKCSSDILKAVDNFALLCLDISWCYLCLQSVSHLPDAESRLKTCEECLQRSYGQNFERLQALKGGMANEVALMMRLHLLQGIVAFHRQLYTEAQKLLGTTQKELKSLHVDDEKMTQMIALGYRETESRLALRNCQGNVELAVSHIIQKQEEREERLKKEQLERRKRKLSQRLGMTNNGEWLNVDMYSSLLNMGYSKAASKEALKQANNLVSLAVQLLHENPQIRLLQDAGPSSNVEVTDAQIAQIVGVGFDPVNARNALKKCNGDVQRAVELLISSNGFVLADDTSSSSEDSVNINDGPSKEEIENAFKRLKADVPEDEEAHLDFTLEEETKFLEEYILKLLEVQRRMEQPSTSRQSSP